MYVRGGARITSQLWSDRWFIIALITAAIVTEIIEPFIRHLELFSVVYVGVFSTALSIFLVFRFNEAYERWWEARKLWGALVNTSRDFARQVLTLLDEKDARVEGPGLIYRQIAFVHALRTRLREGESEKGRLQLDQELNRLVPDEAAGLRDAHNIPNILLKTQSERVASLLRESTADRVLLARFDATFEQLHHVQGACERIKTTAFPDAVAMITRILVWGLVLLLLLATVGPEGRGGVIATIAVCIMSLGYLWIESLTRELKDPFEGLPNDTPMTALCVTVERDLREMLGESDLPEPVKPVRGVLM